MMDIGTVSRWGIEPYESEPAHGFFLRLALLNGQFSVRSFAMSLGLDARYVSPQPLLDYCISLPILNKERLFQATPIVVGNFVLLGGQRFRKRKDWTLARRRCCISCLREAAFHRNWWDLQVLSVCPTHGDPLVESVGGLDLDWNDPGVAVALHESVKSTNRLSEAHSSWGNYVLGRIGISERKHTSADLDQTCLSDICALSELVGSAVGQDQVKNLPADARRQLRDPDLVAQGFWLLADAVRLEQAFVELLRSNGATLGTQGAFGVTRYLGSRADKFQRIGSNPVAQRLREALLAAAHQLGLRRPKLHRHLNWRGQHLVPLKRLAGVCLPPDGMRQVCARIGVPLTTWCGLDAVPQDRIADLKCVTSKLVSNEEAATALGVPIRLFDELSREGVIAPWLKLGGGLGYRFSLNEIDDLLSSLRTGNSAWSTDSLCASDYARRARTAVAKVIHGVVTGKLRTVGWDAGVPGLLGVRLDSLQLLRESRPPRPQPASPHAVTTLQAAAMLGVNHRILMKLVSEGILQISRKAGAARLLSRKQVTSIAAQFAPASAYAEALQCHPSAAHAILASRFKILAAFDRARLGGFLVDRRLVENALGLSRGEFSKAPSLASQLWKRLRAFLDRSGARNILQFQPGSPEALLRDATGKIFVRLHANRDEGTIEFVLHCSDLTSRRRLRLAQQRRALIAERWPQGVHVSDTPEAILIKEVFPLRWDGPVQSEATFSAIEERFLMLRSIFTRREIAS